MITFLLGLPGSGKSYYAVDRIYNNFSEDKEAIKDKKASFKNCYTNINQFKFDKVKNVFNLDLELLYKILVRLHAHYKAKKDDEYLLKYLSRVKLKDSLIVIDEAHNFLDAENKVLVWWLSYHRHLHHEIILITQNHTLISAKYKAFSEFFYVAKPSSLRLFKSHFKYNIYTTSRQTKASHVGNTKIKLKDKVFSLYHSGDSVNVKNVVLKFILIAISIFIVLITFFYFFISSNADTEKPIMDNYQTSIINKPLNNSISIKDALNDYSNLSLIEIKCSNTLCISQDLTLHKKVFEHYLKTEYIKEIYSYRLNLSTQIFYLEISNDFVKYLKGVINDEKFNDNLSSGFKPFGG